MTPWPDTTPRKKGEIEFTPEAVTEHLDTLIEFWRNKKVDAESAKNDADYDMAACYVDAYQCIRKNLFGETKT